MTQTLVAGIDSSTQSCKVIVREAATGAFVRSGSAKHASGTEVDPEVWWRAAQAAIAEAGGLDDVAAVSVGGQQHGMVALSASGEVVRDALLWNDVRSAPDAEDLIRELGEGDAALGRRRWAQASGSVPVASFTITKLRWLARHEPANAARVAAVALPHDWLSWRLAGHGPVPGGAADLGALFTDRSDASGTGYFSGKTGDYRYDLLELAFGSNRDDIVLPRVLGPAEAGARLALGTSRALIGPGCGDNAGAALGLDLVEGEVALSIGTSGVASVVAADPTFDETGMVTGFSDATGRFLPLACTLNASRTLDAMATALGVDHDGLGTLALSAPPGAEGLVLVPYLEGERTPNLPDATGSLHGMRVDNVTPANLARAAVEGTLCGLADAVQAMRRVGVPVDCIALIGGGARSEAVRRIAPSVLGMPVLVPEPGEYVADGAARQAAWVLAGGSAPPTWAPRPSTTYEAPAAPFIRERYAAVRDLTASRTMLGMPR